MKGLPNLIHQLLLLNKINIDKQELTFQIESHPSYPSLHSITGVLDHFNIDNLAFEIPKNKETLAQLPKSFIAQINTHKDQEFVVVINKGSQYNILFGDSKKKKVSIDTFLYQFTGIIVAVEKTNLVKETKANTNFFDSALITVSLVLVFGLFMISQPSIISILFFVASLLGILFSLILKKQGQGLETVIGNAFCSGASEFKDCNAVLSSKGAQVFGSFKLYDLSFIYFTGLALSVFLLSLLNNNLALVYVISFIAFPITLYSIYYQYAVLKTWCFLCLSVVAVLWIQTTLVIIAFRSIIDTSFSLNTILVLIFSFVAVLVLWNNIAPQLNALKHLKDTKVKYFKFKRNFNLFNTLLNQSKVVSTHIIDTPEIVFGNNESLLQITIITNPFCSHCKAVHALVENILNKYKEDIRITIRFGINPDQPESDLVKIASRLLELYHQDTKDKCLEAMHYIYNGMSPELWLNTFGTVKHKEVYIQILNKENKWCKDHNINFTPEILINGRSFPKEYDRSDLLFFIEDLYETVAQLHNKMQMQQN